MRVKLECTNCFKRFTRTPSRLGKYGRAFHSVACWKAWRRKEVRRIIGYAQV